MKTRLIFAAVAALALVGTVSCGGPASDSDKGGQHGIGIAAHRGFWACEEGTFVHNSIASLRTAQEYGFWGSELDLHLTTDEVIVVFHDNKYHNIRIDANPFSKIESIPLKNGEKLPTLDDYLTQAAKNPKVSLVVELKQHPTPEQEDRLIELTFDRLKAFGLYDPNRITFISFSRHVCDVIARTAPEFANQYLEGDYSPDELAKTGINGVDYEYRVFYEHPEWYDRARALGMSVNCWTVDTREDIEKMVDLGVDFITTNQPLLVREILAEKGVPEI